MTQKRIIWLTTILISAFLIFGCSPRSKYEHRLKREMAKGERHDSLFMGLYLGMPDKEFYTRCWQLNRKGLIKQGSNNASVEYITKDELKHAGTMNFYPTFVEGKIYEMPVKFAYSGWAPWNKDLSSDKLQQDVLAWYQKVYGRGFIRVRHPKNGVAYVKIDGNRRITIFKEGDLNVWAIFTDMSVNKRLNDTTTGSGTVPENINSDSIK
jgi:hypothetical protein